MTEKLIDIMHSACVETATRQERRKLWLGESALYRHKLIKLENFAAKALLNKDSLNDDCIRKLRHILIMTDGVL